MTISNELDALVVDDDANLTRLWALALREAGLEAAIAPTVAEARAILSTRNVKVCIVDIFFAEPGAPAGRAEGIKLLSEIHIRRQDAQAEYPKVIAVSGAAPMRGDGSQLKGLQSLFRADLAMDKPFKVSSLVRAVKELMAGGPAA